MESSEYRGSRIGFVLSPPEPSSDLVAAGPSGMVEVPASELNKMVSYVRSLERRVMELEGRGFSH
jgi:hypothetical protein